MEGKVGLRCSSGLWIRRPEVTALNNMRGITFPWRWPCSSLETLQSTDIIPSEYPRGRTDNHFYSGDFSMDLRSREPLVKLPEHAITCRQLQLQLKETDDE